MMIKPVMFKLIRTNATWGNGAGADRLAGLFYIVELDKLDTKKPMAVIKRVMVGEGEGELGYTEKLPLSFVLEIFERCEIVTVSK